MNYIPHLNARYAQLCQQLGDAQIKSDQILDLVADLKVQITRLNEMHPILAQVEGELSHKLKATSAAEAKCGAEATCVKESSNV